MTEEASESLVRAYLENKGYLVTTNKHLRLKHNVKTKRGLQRHNPAYEIDIIAVNPKTKDKIIGEVKGWRSGLHLYHFKKLRKAKNKGEIRAQKSLKIINNKKFRNKLQRKVEQEYGVKGFRISLFADHIEEKDRKFIEKLMKQEKFNIITFGDILKDLDRDTFQFSYSNDQIMQLLRIQKRILKE